MRQLSLYGQVVEISEEDFLQLVRQLAQGYHVLAESCHNYHVSGFADWKGTLWRTSHTEGRKLGEELEVQISDEELRESFHLLRERVEEMIEADEQIVQWLARFVGLSSPRSRQDRKRLGQRLHNRVRGGDIEEPVGPIWATEPGYQALAKRSAEVMLAASDLYQRVEQRLRQLSENVGEEGHQSDLGQDTSGGSVL